MGPIASRLRDTVGRFTSPTGRDRVDLESICRLPSSAARLVLEDPWRRPHLAIWASLEDECEPDVMLRLERAGEDLVRLTSDAVDVGVQVRVTRRRGPGNLVTVLWGCPSCGGTRRFLYVDIGMSPRCRGCARLRWASEGRHRARHFRRVCQFFGDSPDIAPAMGLRLPPKIEFAAISVATADRATREPVAVVPHPRLALAHFPGLTIVEDEVPA